MGGIFLRNLDFVLANISYHFYTLTAKLWYWKQKDSEGPTAGLDALEKRRNSCLFRKSIPASPVIEPVPKSIKQGRIWSPYMLEARHWLLKPPRIMSLLKPWISNSETSFHPRRYYLTLKNNYEIKKEISSLDRAFRKITSTINQQMHPHNFHLKHFKTLKTTPTCFGLFRSSSGNFVVPC